MRARYLALAILLACVPSVRAQTRINNNQLPTNITVRGNLVLTPTTVGALPAASTVKGALAAVTDGTSSSDCTTGGGSTFVVCSSNGTTWSALGGINNSGITAGDPTSAFDSFTKGFLTSPFDKRFSFRSLNDSLNHFAALGVVAQDNAFGGSSGGYQAFQAVLEANPSTNTALGVTAGSLETYVNNATGNFTGTGTNGPAGLLTITQVDSNVNIAGEMSGSIANVANFGASNTIARAVGFHSAIGNTNTATMTEADNFLSDAPQMGTGGVTKWVGFHALSPGGVGTTNYGFLADDAGTAAGTWAFFSGGSTPSSFGGNVKVGSLGTQANCSSSASPAACGAAASGSVNIAAAASAVVVDTTAVTANSQIQVTFDSSLGTKLGVTCNTTAQIPTVSARTGGTSFTIAVASNFTTNPGCFSYTVVN